MDLRKTEEGHLRLEVDEDDEDCLHQLDAPKAAAKALGLLTPISSRPYFEDDDDAVEEGEGRSARGS